MYAIRSYYDQKENFVLATIIQNIINALQWGSFYALIALVV